MAEENQKVFGHEQFADDGVGLEVRDEASLEREAGFGLEKSLVNISDASADGRHPNIFQIKAIV